jgi:hypothetical protein
VGSSKKEAAVVATAALVVGCGGIAVTGWDTRSPMAVSAVSSPKKSKRNEAIVRRGGGDLLTSLHENESF